MSEILNGGMESAVKLRSVSVVMLGLVQAWQLIQSESKDASMTCVCLAIGPGLSKLCY